MVNFETQFLKYLYQHYENKLLVNYINNKLFVCLINKLLICNEYFYLKIILKKTK